VRSGGGLDRLALIVAAGLLAAGVGRSQALPWERPEKAPGMPSTAPPSLVIEGPQAGFPDAYPGQEIVRTFELSNTGSRPVRIEAGLALSEGGSVQFEPSVVPPGGRGRVTVRQALAHERLGKVSHRFALVTDEPGVARYRMSLSGFVQSAYEPEQPAVALGMVDRDAGASAALELASREVERLEVATLEGAPAWLETSLQRAGLLGENVELRLRGRPGAPLGVARATLRLGTNVPSQPVCLVHVTAQVFGDVYPVRHPLSFDLVRATQPKVAEVELLSRSGAAVAVTSIEDPAGLVTGTALPCPGRADCARLRLTALVSDLRPLEGQLQVRLQGLAEPLPLSYVGWVVRPDAEVRELGSPFAAPAPAPLSTPAPAPPAPPPTAPPTEAAAVERPQVRLAWSVRQEDDVYGYLVYRSQRAEGPFVRVNAEVVHAAPAPDGVGRYQFVDLDVRPGASYYYYLDTLTPAGLKKRFSGVQSRRVPELGRD